MTAQLAAQHLAEAVRFRTVSHQDPQDNDWAEWDRLHAWLAVTYPAAHAALTRELVAGHTLVYTWRGTDPSLPPIVLMAHHDVVPVTPGTEQDWSHPPFDGVIADGAVWGRGAVDDKGSLIGLFEGIESLVDERLRASPHRVRGQRARRRGWRYRGARGGAAAATRVACAPSSCSTKAWPSSPISRCLADPWH